jgi:hypothetical protein
MALAAWVRNGFQESASTRSLVSSLAEEVVIATGDNLKLATETVILQGESRVRIP